VERIFERIKASKPRSPDVAADLRVGERTVSNGKGARSSRRGRVAVRREKTLNRRTLDVAAG
jgi:hypothetical protein